MLENKKKTKLNYKDLSKLTLSDLRKNFTDYECFIKKIKLGKKYKNKISSSIKFLKKLGLLHFSHLSIIIDL